MREMKGKPHKQLHVTKNPLILVIVLPPHIGADQQNAKWATGELATVNGKIGALVISDTYRLTYGAIHTNEKVEFNLTKTERDYISSPLIVSAQLYGIW